MTTDPVRPPPSSAWPVVRDGADGVGARPWLALIGSSP
jgi:hypothetical protein